MKTIVFSFIFLTSCLSPKKEVKNNYFESNKNKLHYKSASAELISWNNKPLFLADWDGKRKPYILNSDEITPLFRGKLKSIEFQFDRVLPLSNEDLLLVERPLNYYPPIIRRVFIFNSIDSKLTELRGINVFSKSSICILPNKRLIAWTNPQGKSKVSEISRKSEVFNSFDLPLKVQRFTQCSDKGSNGFVFLNKLINKNESILNLTKCHIINSGPDCQNIDINENLKVTDAKFWKNENGEVGLLFRKSINDFKKAYILNSKKNKLLELNQINYMYRNYDILSFDGELARLRKNLKSKLSIESSSKVYVQNFVKIKNQIYGIIGSESYNFTIGKFENSNWHPIFFGDYYPASQINAREIWLTTDSGNKIKGNLYTSGKSESAILFFQGGGPPRPLVYSPYTQPFIESGIDVLWVNYQGLSNSAFTVHAKPDNKLAKEAAFASYRYLKRKKYKKIIVWGISAGNRVANLFTFGKYPVSGVIDYLNTSWKNPNRSKYVRKRAEMYGFKYFTVRARYDIPDPNPADILLPGFHHSDPPNEIFNKMIGSLISFIDNSPNITLE